MNHSPDSYEAAIEPRATRIHLPHRPEIATEIWMGGTDSVLGQPLTLASASGAVVIDCCGDLPAVFRDSAARYLPRVFMDAEVVPFAYPRLAKLTHDLASQMLDRDAGAAPPRIYVLCQYGMNRSGLLTGLLLRALGEQPEQAVALIQRLRPGSLSNQTFVSLIERWTCPDGYDN